MKFDKSDLDIFVHSIAFSYRDEKRAGAQTKRVCLDQFEFKNFQLRCGMKMRLVITTYQMIMPPKDLQKATGILKGQVFGFLQS